MTLSEVHQTFPAVIGELHNMLDFIKRSGKKTVLREDRLMKLELACEEFLVNIISYAYNIASSIGTIDITCKGSSEYFEVTIVDYGRYFDPAQAIIDSPTNKPLKDREPGGLGIFLARSSVDEVRYERLNNTNTLRIYSYFNKT
ncbi:ATP-binding protein [Chlamydiifrater phoenicopteri]|uniref:ATP-binding protein n=1 Tax=Chlamydiifrater phoenicopteri TaxID=2681469 RepID=UPI001BD1886D|nr:anti-sigma regulatory factor [Chlamydiifrater phoenicopteri]